MRAAAPNADLHMTAPLCMDARMLATTGGTGVSSYACALRRAQQAIDLQALLLTDRIDLDQPPSAPFGRPGRWLRALAPWSRQATPLQKDPHSVFTPDLFRLAQVYFDVHRRPLPLRLPGPPGIMHWTYPVPLAVRGWRNLYTVHDAIPLLHPELTHIDGKRYRRLLCALARCATRLIAVSETARREIVAATGCPAEFVTDCSLAIDTTAPDVAALPPGLTPGAYLLVCGTVEWRKNIERLLQAYRTSGISVPLVIAGPDGWGAAEIAHVIERTPEVLRLPYLAQEQMRALLASATALVMPSLAEGFGLPVAEAMALGTPVLTSNRGALAETAGGAALTVDPTDVAALADGLRRLTEDAELRADLAAAGRRNAERFTPDRFARRLTEVYRAVMAEPA